MFEWIAENAVTIIVLAIVLVIVGIAVFSLVKQKKNKSCCCTGDCSTCGMGCSYGKKK